MGLSRSELYQRFPIGSLVLAVTRNVRATVLYCDDPRYLDKFGTAYDTSLVVEEEGGAVNGWNMSESKPHTIVLLKTGAFCASCESTFRDKDIHYLCPSCRT